MGGETLNLDETLKENQEENPEEKPAVETPAEETPAEETPKKEGSEEAPKEDEETSVVEKDEFEGLEEGKDFYTLNDGTRVKARDLIDGYMRQEDYTQKTMDLSESRRQIELAKGEVKVDTTKEKKAAIDLTEQNQAIETALGEMDESDPLGIILKGLFNQNNQVINFINTQTEANEKATVESLSEDNIKNAQKLITDSLDKEAKNYNLPVIKGLEGEDTDMRQFWNELVLADLQAINENLTLAQYNHRVSQIGKNAYKRLRTLISAASAKQVKEEAGNDEEDPPKKEIKSPNASEESPKPDEDKNKGLSLNDRISNALDTQESKR